MPALSLAGSARRATGRLVRGLDVRGRIGLGLGASALLVAVFLIHHWWTAWTPRLALRTPGGCYPLAFSGDGSTLLTSSVKGMYLWDTKDGRKVTDWASPDGRRWSSGKFSPDGRTVAASWFQMARLGVVQVDLIEVGTGKARATVAPPLPNLLGFAFRDEGRTLRVVAGDMASRVFVDVDVATGLLGPSRPISCPVPWTGTSLSEDGGVLALIDRRPGAATGRDGVVVWDLDRDRQVSVIPGQATGGGIGPISLSADGKSLAIGRDDRPVEVWDVATARLRSEVSLHGSDYRPWMLWLSPDGSKLASFGRYYRPAASVDTLRFLFQRVTGNPNPMICELVVVDLADGRKLGRSGTEGMAVVFSKDGRALASADDDGNPKLHDLP